MGVQELPIANGYCWDVDAASSQYYVKYVSNTSADFPALNLVDPFNGEMNDAIDALQDSANHKDNSCLCPSQVFAHAGEIPCTVRNNKSPRETTHCVAFQADEGIVLPQSAAFIASVSDGHKHLKVCNEFVVQHGEMVLEFQSADSAMGDFQSPHRGSTTNNCFGMTPDPVLNQDLVWHAQVRAHFCFQRPGCPR